MKKIKSEELLTIAVEIESIGQRFYNKMSGVVKEEHLKVFFSDIAKIELVHCEKFKKMREKIIAEKSLVTARPILGKDGDQYIDVKEIKDRLFNRYDLVKKFSKLNDFDSVLNVLMELEESAIDYYQKISPMISPSEVSNITNIINEEKMHYKELTDLRNKLRSVI
jgi:rubrerythrin